EVAEIHYHYARALLWANRLPEALQAYQQAFERDPEGSFDRRECFDRFKFLEFDSLPEFWHTEITLFFRRADVDKSRYAMAGLRVLMAKQAFRLYGLLRRHRGLSNRTQRRWAKSCGTNYWDCCCATR